MAICSGCFSLRTAEISLRSSIILRCCSGLVGANYLLSHSKSILIRCHQAKASLDPSWCWVRVRLCLCRVMFSKCLFRVL